MTKFTSIGMIFFLIFYFITTSSCALAPNDSNNANQQIEIYVHDIDNNTVKGATVILSSLNSNVSRESGLNLSTNSNEIQPIYLFTDPNGKSIFPLKPGTYNFSIYARNYKNESKNITIFDESPGIRKIEFTLIPDPGYDIWIFFLPIYLGFLLYVCWLCGSSEKMKLVFILFLLSIFIPFICLMSDTPHEMFFYVVLFLLIFLMISFLLSYLYFYKKLPFAQNWEALSNTVSKIFGLVKSFLTILTVLSWALIACYFACEGYEIIVISDLSYLMFPSYIVIGVTIGVLSYLMLTIEHMFIQLLPAHKKKSIVWECTRRIIIAPYIAIAGVYLIFYVGISGVNRYFGFNSAPEPHFAFLFSIFAGVFTSTIEEWIYKKVRDTLGLNTNNSTEDNDYYIEKSDFVKLGMSEDLRYRLYYEANISNMQDLANSDVNNLYDKLKPKYSEKEIQYYVELAKRALEGFGKTNVS